MVKRGETLTLQSTRYGEKEKVVSIDKVKEWLKNHDMTKHIGVIYSGVCSITFNVEDLIESFLSDIERKKL